MFQITIQKRYPLHFNQLYKNWCIYGSF